MFTLPDLRFNPLMGQGRPVSLPDPRFNSKIAGDFIKNPKLAGDPLLAAMRDAATTRRRKAANLADHINAMQSKAARQAHFFGSAPASVPRRWFRLEPRASLQYAAHMTTAAARDRRLTPQSKALLQVLRARCGNGTRTETCKTTLAHIMGVCTRSIGRYVGELVRFGYIVAQVRIGKSGLHTGLCIAITEKVLPCFRKTAWLAGWLAQNLPETPANPGRTELSYKNHSHKESFLKQGVGPEG